MENLKKRNINNNNIPTKLFSDLYLAKFLIPQQNRFFCIAKFSDTSAKPFFFVQSQNIIAKTIFRFLSV